MFLLAVTIPHDRRHISPRRTVTAKPPATVPAQTGESALFVRVSRHCTGENTHSSPVPPHKDGVDDVPMMVPKVQL